MWMWTALFSCITVCDSSRSRTDLCQNLTQWRHKYANEYVTSPAATKHCKYIIIYAGSSHAPLTACSCPWRLRSETASGCTGFSRPNWPAAGPDEQTWETHRAISELILSTRIPQQCYIGLILYVTFALWPAGVIEDLFDGTEPLWTVQPALDLRRPTRRRHLNHRTSSHPVRQNTTAHATRQLQTPEKQRLVTRLLTSERRRHNQWLWYIKYNTMDVSTKQPRQENNNQTIHLKQKSRWKKINKRKINKINIKAKMKQKSKNRRLEWINKRTKTGKQQSNYSFKNKKSDEIKSINGKKLMNKHQKQKLRINK